MFLNVLVSSIFQLILLALIPFIWWLCTARKTESFFKWIGVSKPVHEGRVLTTLIVTIVAVVIYALSMIFVVNTLPDGITTAGSQFTGMGLKAIPAVIVYSFIQTAMSEELFFRGFLLKRLNNKFGFIFGNTVQAILFGLLHGLPFALATGSVKALILCTVFPGAFGWFEGWLNEKCYSASVIPSWLMHGIINFIVAVLSL